MQINELKPGDRVTQHIDNQPVAFEVLAIRQLGRRVQVTFQSALGIASASYPQDAHLCLA